MSTIAWDGRTLAADRGSWSGNMQTEVCKLFVFKEGEIGRKGFPPGGWASTGDWAFNHAFAQWLMDDSVSFPLLGKDTSPDHSIGIWVTNDGQVFRAHVRGILTPIMGKIAADGAGQMFALGALAMGGTAERAISLAAVHTDAAAFGVDTWSPPCSR
jgi:hypothetical protein